MTLDTIALPVTIVSTDANLLRDLSWTLTTFGYQVAASSDWSEEAPWQQSSQPGLLLLDARGQEEADQYLATPRGFPYVYQVAIQEPAGDVQKQLLPAGADDVIHYPVNTGELLARLRAGVRRIEFERRLSLKSTRDKLTGLATRHGFVRRLERQQEADPAAGAGTLVVCGIDFFELIREEHGRRAAQSLTVGLSRCLERHLGTADQCSMLGEGVFGALLRNRSVQEGVKLAESVAAQYGGRDTLAREIRSRPTLSVAVLEWKDEVSPAELVQQGLTSLGHVRSYGGNRVVRAEEVEQDVQTWRRQMEACTLFQTVVAQDVMEPFPWLLSGESLRSAERSGELRRAIQAGSPLPPCIPAVDEAGLLAGVVGLHALRTKGTAKSESLADHVAPLTAPISPKAPLSEVLEAFSAAQEGYLVVVDPEQRPLGYITCEALTALFAEPLDARAYRQEPGAEAGLAAYAVPLERVAASKPDAKRQANRSTALV